MNDALQFEYSVCGACCIDQRFIAKAAQLCTVDDFQINACAALFDAAVDADSRCKAFDAVLAADALSHIIPDAKSFVSECMSVCPSCRAAEEHARLLHEKATVRRLRSDIEAAFESADNDVNAGELATTVASICDDVARKALRSGRVQSIGEACAAFYDSLFEKEEHRICTGFPKLDGILQGLHAG